MFNRVLNPLFICLLCTASLVEARSLPDFTELIAETSPAVVKISTIERGSRRAPPMQMPDGGEGIPDIFRHLFERPNRPSRSMGSGFIVSGDGYIVTNFHVVEGADEITVRLIDRREYKAELIGSDPRSDLALLKIDAEKLPTLKFSRKDNLKVGEWVVAIGSPFGLDYSASVGIVSALGRSIPTDRGENYVPFIQTDVAINPGNSGGPLFNLDGEVVGVNSQIFTRSGGSIGLSFAIPVGVVEEVVGQLKDKGHVDRGWLGVMIQEVERNLAKGFGLSKPMGALVVKVEPNAPADKAGIRVGDILIKFGRSDIEVSGDLPHAVGRERPGSKVPVTLMREGKKKVITVEVGKLPGSDPVQQAKVPSKKDAGGRMGVDVVALDERLKDQWGISEGVRVTQVYRDSPAQKAGLQVGDVIAQLGFKAVTDLDNFHEAVKALPGGELLPVRFFRRGRPIFRTISLPKK